MYETISLADALKELSSKEKVEDADVKMCIQNYLHYIKYLRDNKDMSVLKEIFINEPLKYTNLSDDIYCYVAAMIEQITKEINIDTPSWVYKCEYYLDKPWFPSEVFPYRRLKKILMEESPEAFKKRNIFVSKNALSVM